MQYALDYLELTLRQNSKSAEDISKIRWEVVNKIQNVKRVLDYGSGIGWFRAFRPDGITVDTYDVNPVAPTTGINHKYYDVICFWDVLEHIPDFSVLDELLENAGNVVISVPIIPDGKFIFKEWKHYKPGEHLHYFTHETLDYFFKQRGFVCIWNGTPECPPRSDIHTFIYAK